MFRHKYSPSQVYNMDGNWSRTWQYNCTKGINKNWFMNAAGIFIPPLFVPSKENDPYSGKRGPDLREQHALITVDHVKSSPEQLVILILGNHYSHVMLKAYNFSKSHGIVIVSIPPHTPPFNTTGPLKKACHRECDILMKVTTQRFNTPGDFAALFNRAHTHVATIAKDVSGFKATGIMHLGANIFKNEDFAFAIETGNLTTVPLVSSSQSVETSTEKATVSIPTNDTADSMTNTCTSIQHSPTVSFESISPQPAKAKSVNTVVKKNKCGHHAKEQHEKEDPEVTWKRSLLQVIHLQNAIKCLVSGESGMENEMWYRWTVVGFGLILSALDGRVLQDILVA
ncbi:hypothetical protein PR048_010825 [Dryococelus australis]|uniref:DDE-1 domain-containing protein n=1 Tax=Dryococelus australis TaxID=614101 RepID=A0ABQ9I4Z3_9NEOP|nr:hypothetical protein PR048_010825 [Dryococelus australis]